jgi:hypothetical protein
MMVGRLIFRFRLRSPNHRLQALLIAALRMFFPLTTPSPLAMVQEGHALRDLTQKGSAGSADLSLFLVS